jgi:hypothetical protein
MRTVADHSRLLSLPDGALVDYALESIMPRWAPELSDELDRAQLIIRLTNLRRKSAQLFANRVG